MAAYRQGKKNFPNPNFPIEVGTTAIFEAARILGAFQAVKLPQLKILNADNFAQNYIANGNMTYTNEDELERTIRKMKAIVRKSLPQTSATVSFDLVNR